MTAGGPVVARDVASLRAALRHSSGAPTGVGFVPTMGFLHEGHATLMRRARAECEMVVASVFVNPTQFGPNEDFAAYPRDLDRDLGILAREGVDVAFVPGADFYPAGADTFVTMGAVAEPLEGAFRPGHFRGVATVVTMLFNAVQPARAYFGEKDWQQLQVIRRMVRDLRSPVGIVSVPTVREVDGLAMSSRNVRLSDAARAAARYVPRALEAARAAFAAGETNPAALEAALRAELLSGAGVSVDYAVVVDPETLQAIPRADAASRAMIAARVGGVRLIDNAALGS